MFYWVFEAYAGNGRPKGAWRYGSRGTDGGSERSGEELCGDCGARERCSCVGQRSVRVIYIKRA